jgi:hypothetical protein
VPQAKSKPKGQELSQLQAKDIRQDQLLHGPIIVLVENPMLQATDTRQAPQEVEVEVLTLLQDIPTTGVEAVEEEELLLQDTQGSADLSMWYGVEVEEVEELDITLHMVSVVVEVEVGMLLQERVE